MRIHWHATHAAAELGGAGGLRLTVQGAPRPGLRVTACSPSCLRLAADGVPLLWWRIADDFCDYEVLRAHGRPSPSVLPPLTAEVVDATARGAAGAQRTSWARTFARLLASSPLSPLHDGEWQLGPDLITRETSYEVARDELLAVVAQRNTGRVAWQFGRHLYPFILRDLSAADSGRVKTWRKHARAGTLPPVLFGFVSSLDASIVLDGHDRLVAAHLERVPAPGLWLSRVAVCERGESQRNAVLAQVSLALRSCQAAGRRACRSGAAVPHRALTIDKANALLASVFTPRLYALRTRAYAMPGGLARWVREVKQELELQAITDSELLTQLHV